MKPICPFCYRGNWFNIIKESIKAGILFKRNVRIGATRCRFAGTNRKGFRLCITDYQSRECIRFRRDWKQNMRPSK